MTLDQLNALLATAPESLHLEFKEARDQFDERRLKEYCVALGNEGGGQLILGVTDTPPRRVVGTQAFGNIIGQQRRLHQSLGISVQIEEITHPDGRVVVFNIPGRPPGTAWHLDGRYLMRSGESLVAMTEDRLREIYREAAPPHLEQPVEKPPMAWAEFEKFVAMEDYYRLLGRPSTVVAKERAETAVFEHLALSGPTANQWHITRLAAVLLARDMAQFPPLDLRRVRVVQYSGPDRLHAVHDWTAPGGYALELDGVLRRILDALPRSENLADGLRVELPTIPPVALREVLVNAMVHQDFSIPSGPPMVEIFTNRVEVANSGTPPIPPDRFIDGYRQVNERLADLARRMRLCEARGSGIDRTIEAIESLHLPPPEFRAAQDRTIVILPFARPFSKMTQAERLRACYQHCVFVYLSGEAMSNGSLRERFALPQSKTALVSQLIANAVEMGLLAPVDSSGQSSRKFARYVPHWAAQT